MKTTVMKKAKTSKATSLKRPAAAMASSSTVSDHGVVLRCPAWGWQLFCGSIDFDGISCMGFWWLQSGTEQTTMARMKSDFCMHGIWLGVCLRDTCRIHQLVFFEKRVRGADHGCLVGMIANTSVTFVDSLQETLVPRLRCPSGRGITTCARFARCRDSDENPVESQAHQSQVPLHILWCTECSSNIRK